MEQSKINVENKKIKIMKTLKFQLLAMMIIIATVNIATTPTATAQRRSTKNSGTEKPVEKDSRSRANTIRKKSTFKNYDSRQQSPRRTTIRGNRNEQRVDSGTVVRKSRTSAKPAQRSTVTRNSGSASERSTATVRQPQQSRQTVRKTTPINNRNRSTNNRVSRDQNQSKQRNGTNINRIPSQPADRYKSSVRRSTTARKARTNKRVADTPSPTTRNINSHNFYRHDNNDRRYTPNKNYHGSNNYWSNNYRPKSMNYNHSSRNFYRKYNYRNYNHWDRRWENYRWNVSSWRDYYNGYNPYSYRYNKYYYHHPVYGDVISRFVFHPNIFIHNHHQYYCYNGHFFRFLRGVGYVLVDLPFGMVFQQLPLDYDQVYINGYLYFRVGNLFFEYTDYGYQLVHYPERYYSYNDDYINHGYIFDDEVYFNN